MPAKALRVLQINTTGEAAYGTMTASTRRLMAITDASLKIADKVIVVPNIGTLGPGSVTAEVAQSGEGKIEGMLTYEDAPRYINGFMTAIAQSSSTTAPYAYPYTAPVSSTQAMYTYTVEYGTTGVTYRSLGTIFSKLSVKGEAGDLWQFSIDTLSKQLTSTGGLTMLAVSEINPVRMADTTLYIDAFSTGTMGATSVSGTLISFEFNVDTKRHLKTFANSLYPTDWGEDKWEGTLKTVMEFNSTAKALVDELLDSTGAIVRRQIRIKASQGSSAALKTAQLDFAGAKVDGETLFSDREGNMTVELSWQGVHTTALANWFACQFQNGSSSTT